MALGCKSLGLGGLGFYSSYLITDSITAKSSESYGVPVSCGPTVSVAAQGFLVLPAKHPQRHRHRCKVHKIHKYVYMYMCTKYSYGSVLYVRTFVGIRLGTQRIHVPK